MKQPKYDNGDKVRDRITGLEGIVTAITVWFNGCVRYVIQPQIIKDGKPVESTSYDEDDLQLLEAKCIPDLVKEKETGGPQRGDATAKAQF